MTPCLTTAPKEFAVGSASGGTRHELVQLWNVDRALGEQKEPADENDAEQDRCERNLAYGRGYLEHTGISMSY